MLCNVSLPRPRACRFARWGAILLASALLVCLGAELSFAQDSWPKFTPNPSGPHAIERGPGFYLALWKLIFLIALFWIWVKLADWIGRDTDELGEAIGMPYYIWNPIVVFSFVLVFMTLALGIPIFAVGYLLLLISVVAPVAVYVVQRNGKVTADRKVFTPAHIKHVLSNLGKGNKEPGEMKQAWELGPAVDLIGTLPAHQQNQANMIEARQSPGFVPVKFMFADAFDNRADKIMLDYTADAVALRYMIDGVWHAANPKVHEKEPLTRQLGDMMLAVMKKIAGLNPAERRARQEGTFRVEFGGGKYDTTILSQGVPTGERVLVSMKLQSKHIPTLEDLGMREKLREQLKTYIGPGAKGFVAFCSMPQDGLTSTWVAALRSTDRLMRDFISIEDKNKREPDVENVDGVRYDTSKGESAEKELPGAILKQPEVICIPEVSSGEVLKILSDWIENEDKLSLLSIRAKEAAEGLLRLAALKPPMEQFAKQVKLIVNQRLIRKLCEQCREAVEPTPELLQRLGIPPGRVQVLYREKQPLPPGVEPPKPKKGDPPLICPNCRGIGYKGRTAIYEFLVVDDNIRKALLTQPKLDVIKQLSRKAGNRNLQEEGILLVALGTTSLAELQRVLKQ